MVVACIEYSWSGSDDYDHHSDILTSEGTAIVDITLPLTLLTVFLPCNLLRPLLMLI